MGKLHELLAVSGDYANVAEKVLKEAVVTFSKRTDHFLGQTRSLSMIDGTRAEQEDTSETKEMVTTVADKLSYVGDKLVKLWDVEFQKESTNQQATADLSIDGAVVIQNAPATWLLGMETKLKRFREVLDTIPTLDPGIKWVQDDDMRDDTWRWSEPQVKFKTEKAVKSKVLYEATKEHPAQIEKWNEDVPVGRISTMQTSGMLSPQEKSDMLDRIDQMIRAVKKARQRANDIDAMEDKHASKVMDFILEG